MEASYIRPTAGGVAAGEASFQRQIRAQDVPLDRLTNNATISEKEKVAEVSRHFEAVLLRQVLGNAQKPHFKSKYAQESSGGAIYRDLVTNQLADGISRSGALGLGKVLATQMAHEPKQATIAAGPSGNSAVPAQTSEAINSKSQLGPRWLTATPSKGAYHPPHK